jgi:cation transport protein ChaC
MSNTYFSATRPVKLLTPGAGTVQATAYVANRRHPQYAGALSLERQAYLVRRSVGASGYNIDYVVNTVLHLRELGVYEPRLEQLLIRLGHDRASRLPTDLRENPNAEAS